MSITVGFVLYPGLDELDFVGAHAPLVKAAALPGCPFSLSYGCIESRVRSSSGLTFSGLWRGGYELESWTHVVIPGGRGATLGEHHATKALAELVACGVRFYTVCSGASLLASTRVLAGLRVAVHHEKADALARASGCVPVKGVVRDGFLYSIGGAPGLCKGLEAGFQVLHDVWPDAVERVAHRMEYEPAVLLS